VPLLPALPAAGELEHGCVLRHPHRCRDGPRRALQTSDPRAGSRLWTRIDRELTDQAPWVVIRTGRAPDFVSRRTGNYTFCYLSSVTGSTGACLDQLWVR
jgi:hypothetical protein